MDNVCLCEAPRIKAKFRRTWECTICGKPEQPNTAEAAHPAPATVEPVKVKPLDWREILTHSGEALSASYGDWGRRIYLRSAPFKGRAEWIEREKAKAQAEFDSYIRAALAPATEGRKG